MEAFAYFNSTRGYDFNSHSVESLLNEIFDFVDEFFYDGTPSSPLYTEFYRNVENHAIRYHAQTSADETLDIYIFGSAPTLRRIRKKFNLLNIDFHA